MPRAGWCRECGEWVWTDESGSCQNGHDAECVERVYEAEPLPAEMPAEQPFGVGEMPAELDRFNWGAFCMFGVWGIVYGVPQLVLLWASTLLFPLALVALASAGGATEGERLSVTAVIISSVLADAFVAFARIWAGANANRLSWARERTRLERLRVANPDVAPRFSVERFRARQRGWAVWGGVILVVGFVATGPALYDSLKIYGLQIAGLVETYTFVIASVALAFWLARQPREQSTEREIERD